MGGGFQIGMSILTGRNKVAFLTQTLQPYLSFDSYEHMDFVKWRVFLKPDLKSMDVPFKIDFSFIGLAVQSLNFT